MSEVGYEGTGSVGDGSEMTSYIAVSVREGVGSEERRDSVVRSKAGGCIAVGILHISAIVWLQSTSYRSQQLGFRQIDR